MAGPAPARRAFVPFDPDALNNSASGGDVSDAFQSKISIGGPTATVAANSPFTLRRHEFLHVPPKKLVHVPLEEHVARWVRQRFGEAPLATAKSTITEMEQARKALAAFVEPYCFRPEDHLGVQELDALQSGEHGGVPVLLVSNFVAAQNTHTTLLHMHLERIYLPAARRYLNALSSLISKGTDNDNPSGLDSLGKLRFEWHYWLGDLYDECWHTDNLKVEQCATLFNLGAMYSMCACAPPSSLGSTTLLPDGSRVESRDVLAHRTKYFRFAAFTFKQLADVMDKRKLVLKELDVNVLDILYNLMLAQAQECSYRAHRLNDGEPLTPEIHLRLCNLSRCATDYYVQVMKLFRAYHDNCADTEQTMHIPPAWYYHCIKCFSTMRITTNLHYAHSLASEETGVLAAFHQKCTALAAAQLNELQDVHPAVLLEGMLADAEQELAWAAEAERRAVERNRLTFNKSIITQLELQRYTVAGLDLVAFPADLVPNDETLRVLVHPQDSFPALVSAATHKAWMEYRQARASRYKTHLKNQSEQFRRMMNVWRNGGAYKLLLAYVQQQVVDKPAAPGELPLSFYETKLGQRLIALKSADSVKVLGTVVKTLVQISQVDMANNLGRMNLVITSGRIKVGELTRKLAETLKEESQCVVSLCDRMNSFDSNSAFVLERLQNLRTERDYVHQLFGRYADILYPTSALPSPLFVARPPSTNTPATAAAAEVNYMPERVSQQIRDAAATACALLGMQFTYQTLEDDLAGDLEKDTAKPSTHLEAHQLAAVSVWIDESLMWMEKRIEDMRHIEREMALLEKRLENTVISAKHLYRFCVLATQKPDLSDAGREHHVRDDTLPEDLPELVRALEAIFLYQQTWREVGVARQFVDRINTDSHNSTSRQV